ncbi:MAG TPA: hypothetical protein VHV28_14775, partial [Solirubrobacteraceae bacterium]|nr:hypothetical protein [Solirubrobacteraceae bacterium]
SGVIGTNKRCAQDTVRVLIQDMVTGRLNAPVTGEPAADEWLRETQPDLVSYADWETLDRHEQELGQRAGRSRVKLTRVTDMLDVLNPSDPYADRKTADYEPFRAALGPVSSS